MPGYHLPYFTAAAHRIYDRFALEVEIVYPEPGADNVRAVASGRYDLCITSVAHFMRARTEDPGLGVRFVFMVARHSHMAVFCVDDRPAVHGKKIRAFDDLEGTSFLGPFDSPFTSEYFSLLNHLGLEPGDFVELPYDAVEDGLAAGKGDVTADYIDLSPRFGEAAMDHGVSVRALPFYQAGIDIYGSGLVANTELLQTRPDAVRALLAAVREALIQTRGDPETGLGALQARFPEATRDRALKGWKAGEPLVFVDGSEAQLGFMEPGKWRRTLDHHERTHGSTRFEPEEVFDSSFAGMPT